MARRRRRRRTSLLGPVIVIATLALLFSTHKLPSGGGGRSGTTLAAVHSGTLDCYQLEQLWEAGGGASSAAFLAAEVARAESDGEQDATDNDSNGTTDYGYWQINTINGGSPASYDPLTNAREAVAISDDGTNWWPWITYRHGAEVGQC